MPQIIYTIMWAGLGLGTLVAGLSTVVGFFGRWWWIFELFSHFRVQYFLFLFSAAILYVLAGQVLFAAAAALLAVINWGMILPLYLNKPKSEVTGEVCTIILANVLQDNRSYQKVCRLIKEAHPHFMALLEVNEEWLEALRPCLVGYPYAKWKTREDKYGIALYSRLRFLSAEVHYFENDKRPSIIANLDIRGESVTVVATHPPPPLDRNGASERNSHMTALARFARENDGHLLVLGDLNTTSWSPYFQDFIRQSGLQDSRVGRGVQPTWTAHVPIFPVPIDHVLHSDAIKIHERRRGAYIGSDHLPVILSFSLDGG